MEDMYYIPDAALYVFVGGIVFGVACLFLFGLWKGLTGH